VNALGERKVKNTSRRRRLLLQGLLGTGAVWLGLGLDAVVRVAHAAWPKSAFDSKALTGVQEALFGTASVVESGAITIKAPDIAENGAVVPVTVSAQLESVDKIAILVENNPQPLAASFDLSSQSEAFVATRIKMGKTSNVVVLVGSGGKIYRAKKEVKVTIGGCGG
jgi:sulfur-oxidizing protein SoxY